MLTQIHDSQTGAGLPPPGTFAAEQYQNLRLRVERLQQTRGVKVVAITSPGMSNGKTLTSINLAAALARGPGARVLLVDADLRRPSVASRLGVLEDGDGLATALGGGGGTLRDMARPVDGVHGLSVVPAGATSHDVHELLRSPRFEPLLADAR